MIVVMNTSNELVNEASGQLIQVEVGDSLLGSFEDVCIHQFHNSVLRF